MPDLIWSPQARDDLQSIWDYYAEQGGLDVADRVLERIYQTSESLLRFPQRGRGCDELLEGARFVVVAPHVVFYRQRREDIEILHVLHGKQDRARRFEP